MALVGRYRFLARAPTLILLCAKLALATGPVLAPGLLPARALGVKSACASVARSLVLLYCALAVTFALGPTLPLTIAVLVIAALAAAAAAGFVLAVVQPTYAIFLWTPLAEFLAVCALGARADLRAGGLARKLLQHLRIPQTTMAAFANLEMTGKPLDYYQTYRDKIRAVTKAKVQEVANTYIHPDKAAIMIVGDFEPCNKGGDKWPGPLDKLGKLHRLSLRDPMTGEERK